MNAAIVATQRSTPVSVRDLFTIGIGPSSSHTVGPMRSAYAFANAALERGPVQSVSCELFGSLALTGKGHGTDKAVMLGLAGWLPETIDPLLANQFVARIQHHGHLSLADRQLIAFDPVSDLEFRCGEFLPEHANALRLIATYQNGTGDFEQTYFSIGGGAIVLKGLNAPTPNIRLAFPFSSAEELLQISENSRISIPEIMWVNEKAWRPEADTAEFLDTVRKAMMDCIDRGCSKGGTLPGGLNVPRRAKALYDRLLDRGSRSDPSHIFEWVSLYALAVNEENAAGGRVVTAPTNGAAGVIPAVIKYYETFVPGASVDGTRNFLMAASAIGILYKSRASISAAEMGCQGEVGVACSMAAAGLVAALNGTSAQVENAAEIGMEHNLGLTCDPIKGLVQIPCIERNTMGAVKAINAAYLALQGDGTHVVSLDAVIETMRQTGEDMRSKYKETSQGGLAVNVVEC